MSTTKPENRFIGSVHRYLPRTYAEKMNNPWRTGTADVWYSGERGDLWVEYKYIERIPRSAEILPDLTPRQKRWLNNRFDEGRNVAVVLGTPTGGVIYRNKEWMRPLDHVTLAGLIVPRDEIARWIFSQVGTSKCQSLT
ncbi:MAG: hypothetical protein KatS3mg015_2666 [Fimbriimonadales bacterium]|nr:MAG: hypothetical protein KatS3mg015_2666 [Fimbriimonadales bacterium]